MNPTPETPSNPAAAPPANKARIVVAVDTSRQSLTALEEAAALAALMHAELEGLFIEDINLLHLCGFPFCNQIGSYTATPRQVDNQSMERELRVMAARLRQETERIALQLQVPWRFHVRRGPVVPELLDAAQSALFLSLGRAGTARRRTLGSTAQAILAQSTRPVLVLGEVRHTEPPLVLLYTGSEAAQRGLTLAAQLAPRYQHQLQVWLHPQAETEAEREQIEADLRTRVAQLQTEYAHKHSPRDAPPSGETGTGENGTDATGKTIALDVEIVALADNASIVRKLQNSESLHETGALHTLILPGRRADLLAHHNGPTILVP